MLRISTHLPTTINAATVSAPNIVAIGVVEHGPIVDGCELILLVVGPVVEHAIVGDAAYHALDHSLQLSDVRRIDNVVDKPRVAALPPVNDNH
jgi:hypothetical protein